MQKHPHQAPLTPKGFTRKLLGLVVASWLLPPLVGFSFLIYLQLLSTQQVLAILAAPWEPAFVTAWLLFALFYFLRFQKPLNLYLREPAPSASQQEEFIARIRRFPIHFWGLFLLYLLMAPSSVILSAEAATDYVATAHDWFRIHLVALVVSIIVGLPLFFRMMDLFGEVIALTPLERPIVSLKSKVFLLGALMPLLVDTMLVQYFWTRTGYFTFETFIVWLCLEVLAIAGTLVFLRSLQQSYSPLENLVNINRNVRAQKESNHLLPCSTDEMGILAGRYRVMLNNMYAYNQVLRTHAHLLGHKRIPPLSTVLEPILDSCQVALAADKTFLLLRDAQKSELVAVAQTDQRSAESGQFRLKLQESSLATWIVHHKSPLAIEDSQQDPRLTEYFRDHFGIRSAIGTPLLSDSEALGVILCTNAQPRHYSDQDQQILADIAVEATLAITTHRLLHERERTQQSLRIMNQRNSLLLESTSEGIIGVNRELRCTFANRAAARMLGYQPGDMVGQDVYPLLFQHQQPAYEKERHSVPLYQAIQRAASQHVDSATLVTSEGDELAVQYSANPMFDENSVSGAVMIFRDITEAQVLARKMDYLATHDSLTGLLNRREFENRVALAIDDAREHQQTHVLCFLDMDQFKVVNDTSGHQAGDELLRQLANQIHANMRSSDLLGRLGGDEFGLLFNNCPVEEAINLAEKLRQQIEDHRFAWNGKSFAVGCSIGVVPINEEINSVAVAMSAADSACYAAKDAGRNCVYLYTPADEDMAQRRNEIAWVSRLTEAIERNDFVLRYQPIVGTTAQEDSSTSIEILLALKDGDELVPPGAFIPAAERYNLMNQIDFWVLESVFNWLREHAHRLDSLSNCFINLSGQSIGLEKLRDFILVQLADPDIPAHKICFEITETAAVANMSKAIEFMTDLKRYGCQFALDDFGSGMSSFSYLKNLPLDYLKIDGNFVRDMVTDPVDRAMVRSIHQVGHVMHIRTIAEFVEKPEILDALREIGIDYAQGFGIAEPRPLSEYFDASADKSVPAL